MAHTRHLPPHHRPRRPTGCKPLFGLCWFVNTKRPNRLAIIIISRPRRWRRLAYCYAFMHARCVPVWTMAGAPWGWASLLDILTVPGGPKPLFYLLLGGTMHSGPLGALPPDPRYTLVLRTRHGAPPTTDPFPPPTAFDNGEYHVTAFRPISEAAHRPSWSNDKSISLVEYWRLSIAVQCWPV